MPCAAMTKATGLVLAGGKSRRMGQDKATLILDNEQLLDRARHQLLQAGCDPILISGPNDLPDRFKSAGPLSGVDAAAKRLANGDCLLVIPVDMPNITASLLQKLLEHVHGHNGVYFQGNPLPFCFMVSESLREYLQSTLQSVTADRSIFAMFKALKFMSICPPEGSEAMFANCNTPEQFEAMGGKL